jgi:hypothetical protein
MAFSAATSKRAIQQEIVEVQKRQNWVTEEHPMETIVENPGRKVDEERCQAIDEVATAG